MTLQSGVTLPAGTGVLLPIYWIQREPRNFPDPERFAPERWVTRAANGKWVERSETDELKTFDAAQTSDAADCLPPGKLDSLLAFSAGARSCVGRRFAMQEAIIVLAACVRELKMEVTDGYVLEHRRKGVTHSPLNGMPLITKKRS